MRRGVGVPRRYPIYPLGMIEMRASIVRAGATLWTVAAIPVVLLVSVSEWQVFLRSPWLLAEAVSATTLGVALHAPGLPAAWRHRAIVTLLTACATFALLHFGPLLGTGLLFVLPPLFATVLLGERGAFGAWLALLAAVAAAGVASHLGLLGTRVPLLPADWARIAGTTMVGLGGCTWVFVRVHRALLRSLEVQEEAARSAQEAAEERARLLRGAAAAQRMESLGRLAGGVAHDMNNALLVIRSGLEHLRSIDDPDDRAAVLAEVSRGVDRASTTARHLLTFSRHDAVHAASCRPASVVTNLAGALIRLFPENVRVEVEAADAPEVALGAPALEQAILTLALRARDAVRGGGAVVLRCGADPETGEGFVTVEDDGPALTPEEQEQLFEPFVAHRSVAHDGLGLALAWATITRCHGRFEVRSGPDRGTRITLRLPPVVREHAPAPVAPAAPRPTEARILLLEDEDLVRSALQRTLRRAGHAVEACGTLAEARTACRARPFDLLITDGVVPDGPVSGLISAFHQTHPGRPVLVVSGYVEEDLVLEQIDRGSYAFLQKPFEPSSLVRRVSELLAPAGESVGA
jgi:signal transduction histidine kinase/CheY-like chemotaxis protein